MHCWVCDTPVARFLPYGLPPRTGRCPHCGAKPRTRALLWYLREMVRPRLGPDAEILEVGPARVSVRHLAREAVLGSARYTGIDVRRLRQHAEVRHPHHMITMDVTRMGFRDGAFTVILCNNTLPYVRDDAAALAEIRRCLAGDGLAILDTHREPGPTRRVAEVRRARPDLDDAWFAENGDQWVYGDDFGARLEAAALAPRVERLFAGCDPGFLRENGLKPRTEIVLAFPSPAAARRFPPVGGARP